MFTLSHHRRTKSNIFKGESEIVAKEFISWIGVPNYDEIFLVSSSENVQICEFSWQLT